MIKINAIDIVENQKKSWMLVSRFFHDEANTNKGIFITSYF